jgi:hypothetical protein
MVTSWKISYYPKRNWFRKRYHEPLFSLDDENRTDLTIYFEYTFDTLINIISLNTFRIQHNITFFIQFFHRK